MAPKRSIPLEDLPPVSSSEEEESSSAEEEDDHDGEEAEGSSSEEDQPEQKPHKHPSQLPHNQAAKPVPKKSDSAKQQAESDSESDSDDDRPNHAIDTTVKSIASKLVEENPLKTTKHRSKPLASTKVALKSAAAVKRGSETDRDPNDSKRSKKDLESDVVVDKHEDAKKHLFQRLWSEDDEIAVLEGIIDFTEVKGVDPSKDMSSFYDFIKLSLHFDVSLNQLKDKVSRLKKKFENHVSKGKMGEDKIFSKAHDQRSFDLSKKIWGSEATSGGGGDSVHKLNGKGKKSGSDNQRGKNFAALKAELGADKKKETEKVEMVSHSGQKHILRFDNRVCFAGMEKYVVNSGLDMLEGAKKAEMEEKWRKLHVEELELFLKRNELIREQAKVMLASCKTE